MTRLNLTLLLLLVVQAAVLCADRLLVKERHPQTTSVVGPLLFPEVEPDDVARLLLTQGGEKVDLQREGDVFVVTNLDSVLADQHQVRQTLEAVRGLTRGSVVSENPDKHGDFGVEGSEAVDVVGEAADGRELFHFVVGKATARAVYLRSPPDSDEVMLVKKQIRTLFDRGEQGALAWRDRQVLSADARDIRGFSITRPDETIRIQRIVGTSLEPGNEGVPVASDEDDWMIVAPVSGMMKKKEANILARRVADLKCRGFHRDSRSRAEIGLEPPEARVEVEMRDGSVLRFDIGNQEDRKRFVSVPGREGVFLVSGVELFGFFKTAEELTAEQESLERFVPEAVPSDAEDDSEN